MEKEQALSISKLIENWGKSSPGNYAVNKLETSSGALRAFHQWSNGKPLVAGFEVVKPGIDGCYLLFIDWHRNDNYYLVIYSHNKSTTLAEIQKIIDEDSQAKLFWKYNPLKRDGKNDQRKAYFKQAFGSLTIEVPIPVAINGVERFVEQLFELCQRRLKADRIVEVFDFD